MITGKIASHHISDKSIKIAEAIVSRGRVEVTNAITIPNADRFFNQSGRLINLVSMVDTIVMSMESGGMTAKKLSVSFSGSALETVFSIDPIKNLPKKGLSGISLSFGKKDGNTKAEADFSKGATIKRRHSWGQFVTQDEQGEAVSVTQAERDMVESFMRAFSSHGYKVISLETPDTALVYTRNTVEYSYDSLNKVVLYADNEESGVVYTMTKDVPSVITPVQFDTLESYSMQDRIRELVLREINKGQMRNPYIYLIGDAFANIDLYIQIAQDLEIDGLQVVDLYGMNKEVEQIPNSIQVCISEEADPTMPELTSEYGLCICLFLRCYEDKPENLCEGKLPSLISPKVSIVGSKVVLAAGILFFAVNLILTGLTGYETLSIRREIQDSTSLRTQLNQAEAKRDDARIQLEALNTIDPRLADVFTFIYENVDSSLNIASVDTIDMLPSVSSSTSNYNGTGEEGSETGEPVESAPVFAITNYTQQQLVIRGYSTKSNGSIELYNALQRAGIGEVRLVGHQQVGLPSGETIYIFELRAGTGV